MRLMTGGGIAALRGIHPIREDGVIRPLLEVTRADTEAFLIERGVTARIDRSNADPRFLRNRIRRLLGELGPEAIENLAAIADQAREQWTLLEKVIDAADTAAATPSETRFPSFPDDLWLRRALLHRHIRRLDPHCREVSAADLDRLANQLDSLKRVSVTANLELLRRKGEWVLRQRPLAVEPFEAEIRAGDSVHGIRVTPSECGGLPPLSKRCQGTALQRLFELPKGASPDFTVRNRRPGDRFQPLGMQTEKKLKDFLIDRKIAFESRDRLPLLLWNGKIVCIAGVEVSEAFKVTGGGDLYEVALEEKAAEESQEGVQREADRQTGREARP
jgi:tRNA(Ile)-lysidine synthase